MKAKQRCPKCKGSNIRVPEGFTKLGDPFKTQGLVGWECIDCGYIGKDFFIEDTLKKR
jgi:hypothetical protein